MITSLLSLSNLQIVTIANQRGHTRIPAAFDSRHVLICESILEFKMQSVSLHVTICERLPADAFPSATRASARSEWKRPLHRQDPSSCSPYLQTRFHCR